MEELSLENKILKILTCKKFRRKRLDSEALDFLLERIRDAVKKSEPITLVIGFGCQKNPNASSNFLPDLAEELALSQLYRFAKEVEKVYEPGMIVNVITSGRRAEMVNGVPIWRTFGYHKALKEITEKILAGEEKDIIRIIPIGDLYDRHWDEFEKSLKKEKENAIKELDDPSKQEFWTLEIKHALRNINHQCFVNPEEAAKQAAISYVSFRRTEEEISLFDREFPDAIRGSYNTGHENTLLLWTLRKGDITQPWQGEAKLIDGGVIVMTQKRLEKYG